MSGQAQKFAVLLLCFVLNFSAVVYAETGSLVHVFHTPERKTSPLLLKQKSDFEEQDKFYKEYFSKTDKQISDIYLSRWQYHDQQVPYAMTTWRHEHLSIGSLDYYSRAPHEKDVRQEFAEQVFRMRTDAGIRAFLYNLKSPTLAKVAKSYQKTMDAIRSYPLRLSNKKDSKSGEFRIGYDVLSDSTKFEYVEGPVEAGLYHPALIGGFITHSRPGWEITTLNVSSNFGKEAPKATLSAPLSANTVEASLSKALSPSVSARLLTAKPLRDQTQPHRYEASVAYTF